MPTPSHITLHPGSRAAHPAFTVSRPNIARVYDYWLGGKDNFAADRDEADRLLQAYPSLPAKVRENRLFLARAVNWMADRGIRQFVDIGSGLPTAQNTHQVAQAVDPSCRVAYVDYDPIVVAHARALLGADGVTAAEGDLGDPAAILGDSGVGQVIRLGEPVGLILGMVLHFFDAQAVGEIMTTIVGSIARGSYVAISVGSGDERTAARLAREYTAETLYNHAPTQIARFFDGLELVAPGLADAGDWDPLGSACPPAETGGHILVGVGRKSLKLRPDDQCPGGSPSAFRSAALARCSALESVLIVACQVLAVGPVSAASARTSSTTFSSAATSVVMASPVAPEAPATSNW
jgi:hypothetical protein